MTVVSQALARGARFGLWAAVGVLLGNALYFGLSATGVLALLVRWYAVFFWIKWAGAAYLVWLGIQSWRKASGPIDVAPPGPVAHAAARGLAVQVSNPKTPLFFGALLPHFLNPEGPLALQIAILGVTSIAIEFGVLASYSFAGSRAARLAGTPRYRTWVERVGGSLLIRADAGLAAIRRP